MHRTHRTCTVHVGYTCIAHTSHSHGRVVGFTTDNEYIDNTGAKLDAKLADLAALDAAVQAELTLVSQVSLCAANPCGRRVHRRCFSAQL